MLENQEATDSQCEQIFKYLFQDIEKDMQSVCPNGWENSSFYLCYHPTLEQRYSEYVRVEENTKHWSKEPVEIQTFEQFSADPDNLEDNSRSMSPNEEFIELYSRCLWDIFSNNHDVIDESGTLCDLGSFRGSAGFIADFLNDNHLIKDFSYNYMDFYMGTIWVNNRSDLTPIYQLIFEKMKSKNFNWKYAFPRVTLVNIAPPKEDEENMKTYNPSVAFEKELEEKKKEEEINEMQRKFDEFNEEMLEAAKYKPLPEEVQAYKNVYGGFPSGWITK